MVLEISTITMPFIFNVTVNAYLIRTIKGFVLIDTGTSAKRKHIEQELINKGCNANNLKLIILTHGDFDHCGNAAYFGKIFDAPITMHEADRGMVEYGDMFWNRKQPNLLVKGLMKLLARLRQSDRFTPNFYVEEGDNLSEYGFDAEVIEIPGHSKGSIGLLTTDGILFCGDLLANTDKPDVWSIIDEADSAKVSVEKLLHKHIKTAYPGHGSPFPMQEFLNNINPAMHTHKARART